MMTWTHIDSERVFQPMLRVCFIPPLFSVNWLRVNLGRVFGSEICKRSSQTCQINTKLEDFLVGVWPHSWAFYFWNPLVFTDNSCVEHSRNPMICPACRDWNCERKLVKGMYTDVTSLEAIFSLYIKLMKPKKEAKLLYKGFTICCRH